MLTWFCSGNNEKYIPYVYDAEVYTYDIGAFSPDWEHHINLLCTILTQLQENGFTENPLKCNWAIKETD